MNGDLASAGDVNLHFISSRTFPYIVVSRAFQSFCIVLVHFNFMKFSLLNFKSKLQLLNKYSKTN